MPENILTTIENAEAAAESTLKQAKIAARDAIKAAEADIAQTAKQAAYELREVASHRREAARVNAQDEIHSLEIRRSAERELLKKTATNKIESTGAAIFERIVKHGDR